MKREKLFVLITAILITVSISVGCSQKNSENSDNSSNNTETVQSITENSQNESSENDNGNDSDNSVDNNKTDKTSKQEVTDNSDTDDSINSSHKDKDENKKENSSDTSKTSQQETSELSESETDEQADSVNSDNPNNSNNPNNPNNEQQNEPSIYEQNIQPNENSDKSQTESVIQSNNTTQTDSEKKDEPPRPSTNENNNPPTVPNNLKTEAESISLSTTSVNLKIGKTVNLNTTVLPKNAVDRSYSFYIDDASIIEYSNGIIKAKNPGETTISFKTANGITARCKVNVYGIPSYVTLNKTSLTLDKGNSYTLSAKTDIGNYNISYKWISSNSDVVSVESTAYSTAVIKAKNPGTATITVKTDNNVYSVCKVTVNQPKKDYADYVQYEDKVIELVNKERSSRGLPKLKKRNDLVPLATIRAKEIVTKFDHERPNGKNSFSILTDNNIQYSAVGENIAYGQSTPERVMVDWMNSEGHRKNILSENFNGIGVGCYEYNGYLYWVQLFIHE